MKNSIKYSIIASALGLATIATFGVGTVMAQSGISNPVGDAIRTQIFDRVVTKLNLNVTSDQLQTAFKESAKEERQAQFKADLDTAVKDGKITQEVADNALKIETARDTYLASETKLTPDQMDNLTRAEIKTKMSENLANMEKAIEENTGLTADQIKSVNDSLRNAGIRSFGPHGKGNGRMGGMMEGGMMRGGDMMGR